VVQAHQRFRTTLQSQRDACCQNEVVIGPRDGFPGPLWLSTDLSLTGEYVYDIGLFPHRHAPFRHISPRNTHYG